MSEYEQLAVLQQQSAENKELFWQGAPEFEQMRVRVLRLLPVGGQLMLLLPLICKTSVVVAAAVCR